MSHTNQTPNYHLPQFLGTDKPAWLVDFNQAMSDIDTQMKANATACATAEANAQSALSGLSATNTQVSGLQTDVTAIQTQLPLDEAQITTNTQNISTQASAIVNANNRIDTANGNITALNNKIGDLADLDTTDKTSIVNAVNEVNADIGDLIKTWTLDFGTYNNGNNYSKVVQIGNVVLVFFSGARNLTVDTYITVGTLPADCPKPNSNIIITGQYSANYHGVGVSHTGDITVQSHEVNDYITGMAMYFVN